MTNHKISISNELLNRSNLQVLGVLLFMVLLSIFVVLGVILVRLESERYQDKQVELVQRNLEDVRLNLRSRIYSNLYKISSLNALIALDPDLSQEDFSRAMEVQFRGEQDLRNIGLAREMILEFMHPIEGNEAAIGLDYRTIPEQFEAVQLALRLNTIILAGPVNLVQGGQGLIARVPLYITHIETQEEEFWGFASVVMNSDSIFQGAGLSDDHPKLQLALRGRDAKGPEGDVFWGDPQVFEQSPITLLVELPYGSWQIAALPLQGWTTYQPFSYSFIWWYLTIVLVILGFTGLIFYLVRKQRFVTEALELERNLFAAGPVFTMEWNPEVKERWNITSFSSNLKYILGYESHELLEKSFSYNDLLHPEDMEVVVQELRANIKHGVDQFEQSYRLKKKNGEFIWLYDFTQLIRDSTGKLVSVRSYMYDQTAQKQTEEALKVAQERLEKTAYELTENIPVGTYTMIQPPEGGMAHFGFMSKKFLEITGLTKEEAATDPLKAFRCIHPEDYDEWVALNTKTFQEKTNFFGVARIILNGKVHWVQAESIPRTLPNGSTVWEGVIADITETKVAEEQLHKAIDLAEQASKAKSEFLANMSHEIRTPLNGIIGFTDLLSRTPLSETQKQYVEYANVAGQSLLGVINDILDFSKIEAGMMDLDLVKTEMIELFEQSIDVISYSTGEKQLEVILDLEPSMPRFAMVDSVRLRQVLVNLLGNASKFTSQGEIELSVRFTPLGEDQGTFSVRVRDTGIGISPDQKEKLFHAFTQADSSTTRKYGGSGLGLVISQKIVQKMGGELVFDSQIGQGTRFSFRFSTAIEGTNSLPLGKIKHLSHCLIIEDNEKNGVYLKKVLNTWGIDCDHFTSPQDALISLQTNHDYDVLLLDYLMPGMDGLATLEQIREMFHSSNVALPVIMLHSTQENEEIYQTFQTLAVENWLSKPIKQKSLFECLERIAANKRVHDSVLLGEDSEDPDGMINARSSLPEDMIPTNRKSQPFTILIAEDVPMNMLLIKTLIRNDYPNSTFLEATNGKQVIEIYSKQSLDIILMDVQMPEMDGLTATREIRNREDPNQKRVPILALTAGAMKIEMDKCFAAGMDDFLTKPVQKELLIEKLNFYFVD